MTFERRGKGPDWQRTDWFRDVDSNHDTQLQRLMSYRLDDPGTAANSLAEEKECAKRWKCARRESFC